MVATINKNNKYKPIQRYRLGYLVAWDKRPAEYNDYDEEGNIIATHVSDTISTWVVEYFDNKPKIEQIKDLITSYYGEGFDADKFDWKPYESLL